MAIRFFPLYAIFFLLIYSCKESEKPVAEPMVITRGDMQIRYDDSKTGDTTLLFLHGWGINRTYWKDQQEHFKTRYRIITMDLPGFGESGKKRSNWTVEAYSEDVSAVIKKLDLKKVILVGHSMSGAIVVETALSNPESVIGIVGVDNLKEIDMVITPEIEAEMTAFYDNAKKDFPKAVRESIAPYLYSPMTDSAIRNRIIDNVVSSDPVIAMSSLQNADMYPFAKKLKDLKVKLGLINTMNPPTNLEAIKALDVSCFVLEMQATSHYPMIENPRVFNIRLEEAIDLITGKVSMDSLH